MFAMRHDEHVLRTTVTITMEKNLLAKLERVCGREGKGRAEIIRAAIERYMARSRLKNAEVHPRADAVAWGEGYNSTRARWAAMRGRYRRRRHVGYRLTFFTITVSSAILSRLEAFSQTHKLSKSQVAVEALQVYLRDEQSRRRRRLKNRARRRTRARR